MNKQNDDFKLWISKSSTNVRLVLSAYGIYRNFAKCVYEINFVNICIEMLDKSIYKAI